MQGEWLLLDVQTSSLSHLRCLKVTMRHGKSRCQYIGLLLMDVM